MRISYYSLAVLILLLSFGTFANAQTNSVSIFSKNLSLGSRGTDVVTLQQILNRDPITSIVATGPGSSGYETNYFGLLTKAAVIRFQEKYASEILVPAGLSYGNGYVGGYTRAKLNALAVSTINSGSVSSVIPPTITTPAPIVLSPSTIPQNPNLKNIDRFLAALDATAARQKISSTTLATITAQIMKDVATTTNLRDAFFKQIPNAPHQSLNDTSFVGRMLDKIDDAFTNAFVPEHALAATGVPFGGALLFPFYCTQSQTWIIAIEPLPPSYAALLTYVPFSQAFLSYNIPATSWLLGEYVPGAGVCVAGICPYCVTIPSEGMISPMVGSSPG